MTSARGSRGASFDRVLSAIRAVTSGREQPGNGYVKVCCPVHGDTNPSCSIRYDAGRGKTSVRCFKCGEDNLPILEAAGLTVADLYDDPRSAPSGKSSNGLVDLPAGKSKGASSPPAKKAAPPKLAQRQVCEYPYPRADGSPCGKVIRYDLVDASGVRVDKTFRPKRHNPDTGRWVFGGFDPVLYRAPEVAAAIAAGGLVYVFEGEKDADRGAKLGLVATTNAGGAKGFAAEHARQLAGARVVLVLHRDQAGYDRGVRLNELLFADPAAAVAELRIVEPTEGNDFADHLDAGRRVEDLVDVDPAAKLVELAPVEAAAKLREGTPLAARHLLDKARATLAKVADSDARNRLAAVLDEFESQMPAEARDQLAEHRRQREQHKHQAETAGGEDEGPGYDGVSQPRWRLPSSSGSWAYSTGQDGNGVPRGVYRGDSHGSWQMVAALPYVLERLNRRDGEGIRSGLSYRLAMRPLNDADEVIICSNQDLREGNWAEQLDVPLSADDKIIKAVATAIRTIGKQAPLREKTPTWTVDEQLLLPSPDVLGGGYGEIYGTEDNARQVWRQVAEIAGRNHKVALALGATLGGLFIKPLLMPQRSIWFQLCGLAQHGKGTTMHWCASLLGDPTKLIETWNSSGKGTSYRMGEIGCMPIFRDEMGASSDLGSPKDRENMILALMEGARRRIGTRDQGTKYSASWYGTLLGSGNDSLIDGITNEAVYARVVEVPAPITDSAEDCDILANLLVARDTDTTKAYGWPLHWLRQDLSVDRIRQLIAAAEGELPLPAGGVPKTMGHNLCLIIAGAAELDRLIGSDTLRPAALAAAREVLGQLVGEMADGGLKPGERVHAALVQAISSRPNSYPTRELYLQALDQDDEYGYDAVRGSRKGKQNLPRDVEGWLIADDDIDGDVAVLSDKIGEITKAAGITDPRPGLRELDRGGVLIRSDEADGKRVRRLRIGNLKWRPYVYVFRLDPDELAAFSDGDEPTGDNPDNAMTRTDVSRPPPKPPPELSPVSPAVPGSSIATGDSSVTPVTRTDALPGGPSGPVVPGVPGSGELFAREGDVEMETLVVAADGPVWVERTADGKLRNFGACRRCTQPSVSRDRLGAVHARCALDQNKPAETTTSPPPAASHTQRAASKPDDESVGSSDPGLGGDIRQDRVKVTGPCPARPTGYRAACIVLDPSGIYLPDGFRYRGVQIRDALDILDLGHRLRIGHPGGPGQLILTDAMCVELGLVAQADDGVVGDDARKQVTERLGALGDRFLRRARDAGWEIGSLRPENRAHRARDDRVLHIVVAPYEYLWTRGRDEVHPLSAVDPGDTLSEEQYAAESARLMGHLAQLLGRPWRSNASQVGWDLFDRGQRARKKRRGHVLTHPARLPQLTGGVTVEQLVPDLTWSRWTPQHPAADADRARLAKMTFAIHVDRKAAWLGSGAAATLGYLTEDEPQMRHHVGAEAVAELLARPEAVPAGVMRLLLPAAGNPAVPPLHPEQSSTRPRWLWVPAPTVSTLLTGDDPGNNVIGWGCTVEELLTSVGNEEDKEPEAWTFPAQGRLLDGVWYETLRDTRYALEALADESREDSIAMKRITVETKLIKHVYSGFLQTTQNLPKQTEATDEATGETKLVDGSRAWHHQATWLSTVKAHHYSWQWSLLRRAMYDGQLVASVQIDEVVFLTDDPDSVALGRQAGRIGQYKRKKVRELSDEHRDQLAGGTPAHDLQGGELE